MNTKIIVPELPSDEEMLAIRDVFLSEAKSIEVKEYYNGVHVGQLSFKTNCAAKHRQAAVVAIEALEKLGDTEALEKIKKIYEQKEK